MAQAAGACCRSLQTQRKCVAKSKLGFHKKCTNTASRFHGFCKHIVPVHATCLWAERLFMRFESPNGHTRQFFSSPRATMQ